MTFFLLTFPPPCQCIIDNCAIYHITLDGFYIFHANFTRLARFSDASSTGLRLQQVIQRFDELERAYGDAFYFNAPVQMGAADSAGGTG